jgi:HEAT repeat protein
VTPPGEPRRKQLVGLLEDPAAYLQADDPTIRRVAVAATLDHPELLARIGTILATDPEPAVRRECAEVLGLAGGDDPRPLQDALQDEAAGVREAAATGLGELAAIRAVPALIARACDEGEDRLVREAAVAALGAIGDPAALPALLDLVGSAPPQVRRRCVAALTVFDGEEVEQALRAAAADRNPMVREAAEMVVGRNLN